jgi:hypothetical protein
MRALDGEPHADLVQRAAVDYPAVPLLCRAPAAPIRVDQADALAAITAHFIRTELREQTGGQFDQAALI